ncbi:hypothetical protein [Parasitella parasitica]|uniref:Uncharacterized protein n=1 Tax=Parasitella parasitica TaxID=35722 RepID=A0A0B7MZ63_9FUNG|nr:hypothetical protein [Parasitella parasitica]
MNAYAYMNDDSTRAFINLRMNVVGVRPYPNVDDDNNLIPSTARRMHADSYDNKKLLKLKYMIYKYVWQNIDNEDVVIQDKLVKESFAHYFSDLHDELCERELIIDGEFVNPVVVKETFLKKRKSNRLSERRREIEYLFNGEKVPRVDWDHPELQLAKLIDNVPFDDSLIALPSVRREQQRAQTTPIEVDQD